MWFIHSLKLMLYFYESLWTKKLKDIISIFFGENLTNKIEFYLPGYIHKKPCLTPFYRQPPCIDYTPPFL